MYRLLILVLFISSSSYGWHWSFANCIGDNSNGAPKSVAVDNTGEIICCGIFYDTLFLPTGNIIGGDYKDAYLIKYDTSGNIIWNIFLTGEFDEGFEDIAVDDSNNIYVTASTHDTIQIQSTIIIPDGNNNGLLFKFSSDGQLLWYLITEGNSFNRQVALDKTGKVIFSGLTNNSVTIGSFTLNNSAGIYNSFIAVCDRFTGNVLDASMISSSGDYGIYGMVADSAGEIYITGYDRPVNSSNGNFFMRRLPSQISAGWSYEMESASGDCYGYGVDLDPFGKVYFTGHIYNNVNFMGNQFGNFGRYNNVVLAKFDTSGTLDWARHYGTSRPDFGNGVACDDSGNVFLAGSFEDSIVISNTTLNSVNNSYADAFLVKMDSSGNVLWDKLISGGFNEYPVAISYNNQSRSLGITGTFATPTDFDSIQISAVMGQDAFVARLVDGSVINVGINHAIEKSYDVQIFIHENILTINLNEFVSCQFTLTDIRGRQIKNGKIFSGLNQIALGDLNTGMYVVSLVGEDVVLGRTVVINGNCFKVAN